VRQTAKNLVSDLKVTVVQFFKEKGTYHASAVTYYALLAIFPALLVLLTFISIFGEADTVSNVVHYLKDRDAGQDIINLTQASLELAINRREDAGSALVFTIALSIYTASSAFIAVGRAVNDMQGDVRDDRNWLRKRAFAAAVTTVLILSVSVFYVLIILGGQLTRDVFSWIGLNRPGTTWALIRTPITAVVGIFTFTLLYHLTPAPQLRQSMRKLVPGATFAVVGTVIATFAFTVYVKTFATYNATYGVFAATVLLLVLIWLNVTVMLLGATLNRVIAERRAA